MHSGQALLLVFWDARRSFLRLPRHSVLRPEVLPLAAQGCSGMRYPR